MEPRLGLLESLPCKFFWFYWGWAYHAMIQSIRPLPLLFRGAIGSAPEFGKVAVTLIPDTGRLHASKAARVGAIRTVDHVFGQGQP